MRLRNSSISVEHLLGFKVTAANGQDCTHVGALAQAAQVPADPQAQLA